MDRHDLYEVDEGVALQLTDLKDPLVLVYALDGFIDAGLVAGLAINHFVGGGGTQRLVDFNIDSLYDYRARRPIMAFEEKSWKGYNAPRLGIDIVRDADNTPFLLLYGQEPDYRWEAFSQALMDISERFHVKISIGMYGLPMAVPHTRPIEVTVPATKPELVQGKVPWEGVIHVPGAAMSLFEYRLGEQGKDGVTYAIHVPEYLVRTPFPGGAVELLNRISTATGLRFDVEELDKAAKRTLEEISTQISNSPELSDMVANLERQYDSSRDGGQVSLLAGSSPLPSGDELAAEFQAFLAQQDGSGAGGDETGASGGISPEA